MPADWLYCGRCSTWQPAERFPPPGRGLRCQACRSAYSRAYRQHRFTTDPNYAERLREGVRRAAKRYPHVCEVCGQPFLGWRPSSRFCGRACWSAYANALQRPGTLTITLPLEVHAALARLADEHGVTVQELVMRQVRPLLRLCTECGLPITTGPPHRKVHSGACEQARRLRYSREQTRREPGRTSSYRQQWYAEHPERRAVEQQIDRRRQSTTLGRAQRHGEPWTDADLRYMEDNPDAPAYAVAVRLGRTVYAVRRMRAKLRQES